MLLRPAGAIDSHFFVSDGSALKMLMLRRRLVECRDLFSRSFGAFAVRHRARNLRVRLATLRAQCASLGILLRLQSAQSVTGYRKLEERLKAELRSFSYLEQQDAKVERDLVETLLPYVRMGTSARLCADGADAILINDALEELERRLGEGPALLLQLADGSVRIATARHIDALFQDQAPTLPSESVARLCAALP